MIMTVRKMSTYGNMSRNTSMVMSASNSKLMSTALTTPIMRMATHGVPQLLWVMPMNLGSRRSRDIWNCGREPVAR